MDDRTALLESVLPDRYELVRELGRGGMATVYLAVDRRHDRRVALKVLSPELVSGVAARRFLREIELVAKLTHPHVLPLLDSGLVDDRPFYVMPFVEGKSLRDRLDEEGTLPVPEALGIARQVGEALACAHDAGIVHRDIKPGNILMTGGIAVVTDFGIATALERDADSKLTRPGHSLGTPGYMSPEQGAGDSDVDQRSDQYALACVLFEMLAGDPPYTGRNLRAILGRQMSQPVPRVSALRDTVPAGLDDVLVKALARDPADRFETMRDFVAALGDLAVASSDRGRSAPRRPLYARPALWMALAAVALAGGGAWLGSVLDDRRGGSGATVRGDTMRYAIFPFDYASGTDSLPLEPLLHDALDRWEEISLVDAVETGEAVARTGREELDPDAAAEVALAEGAGRFVVTRVTSLGDSLLRVQARLYEVLDDGAEFIRSRAVRTPGTIAGADTAFSRLAAGLLLREPPPGDVGDLGTRSLQALQAFDYGQRAVEEWRLSEAEVGFQRATSFDPDFARAQLWVALSRAWQEEPRATWAPPAQRAELGSDELRPRDRGMAEAIRLEAESQTPEACRRWRALTDEHENDFAVWYGLAHCLSEDSIVVREPDSPTGWAFRSGYHSAIEAYREAFVRLPSILGSLHPGQYRALRRILRLSGRGRMGVAETDRSRRFMAFAQWVGDTLAYVPTEVEKGEFAYPPYDPVRRAEAMRQLRGMFREIATTWVAEAPSSARARQALAQGMMMTGEPGALDTLMRARELAVGEQERFDLARFEVWVRLMLSFPDDPEGLRRVRALADSLLENGSEAMAAEPDAGAALATLLGQANLAASWARRTSLDEDSNLMRQALSDGRALLTFAALGGPADSIARLERQVEAHIRSAVPPEEFRAERNAWLIRPATMAFPHVRFSAEDELDFDPVMAAQRAMAAGDTAAVRDSLETFASYRNAWTAHLRTLDTQIAEMRLLAELGEMEAAIEWVEPTLSLLPQVDPESLARPEGVGPLLRIAALRAEIADRLGRGVEAARWARAVTILWADADPFLRPRLEALERLVP